MTPEFACALRLFEVKSRHNLTDDAFQQIMVAVNGNSFSQYQIKKTLKYIVPIEPIWIDMCINSCCAYTGMYKYYNECRICQAPRFKDRTRVPRRQVAYFSIKDRLKIQYQDSTRSEKLRYRANYTNRPDFNLNDKIGDLFDGAKYQELLLNGFFKDDRDVALIGSIDGYQIFKQKTETCWVVLIINANICPQERVKKENLMITAIIPGPKEPKDFNSFMFPIINELEELESKSKYLIIYFIYIIIDFLLFSWS